jgi:hypothetical protein
MHNYYIFGRIHYTFAKHPCRTNNQIEQMAAISKIRALIGDGDIKLALHELEAYCSLLPSAKTNPFHAIEFRHSDLQNKLMKGIILEQEAQVESAQIVDSMLTFLERLEAYEATATDNGLGHGKVNTLILDQGAIENEAESSEPSKYKPIQWIAMPEWVTYAAVSFGFMVIVFVFLQLRREKPVEQRQNASMEVSKREIVAPAYSQSMSLIEGMVVGKNGQPRAGIEIVFGSQKYRSITDQNGRYQIQLPRDFPETVRLQFKRNGVELFQQELLCNQKVLAKLKIID